VLSNGFRIHADRHEVTGPVVRLYAGGGVTEIPATGVAGFEAEEEIPRLPATAPVGAASVSPDELVAAAAGRNGLPAELVRSMVSAESGYRADAVSPKGAIGLMQLMPSTAREYGADPRDPKQNVEAGTHYLRDLLLKYDGSVSHALAAYNAGPGVVDRYHGVPPYRETQAYVARVIRKYQKKDAPAKATSSSAAAKTPDPLSPPK